MIDRGDGDGFLRRWARRKEAANQAVETPPEPVPGLESGPQPGPESGPEMQPLAGQPDAEPGATDSDAEPLLTDADMPPLESLGEASDYSGFMSPGVSEELRRLALRKLFLQPLFNVRDGLDDYDDDFRSFEKLGDILTADMRFQQELEAERRAAEQVEAPAETPDEEPATDDTEVAQAAAADDESAVPRDTSPPADASNGHAPDADDDIEEERG